MRRSALFAFIVLTALDGTPLYVETSQIAIMRDSHSQCQGRQATALRIAGRGLCVVESPEAILKKIRDAK